MSSCSINNTVESAITKRSSHDGGFSGYTHATSAVAMFLVLVAFFPDFAAKYLGSESLAVIFMATLVTAGASLVPDLDNTQSTARNSFGPFGHIISGGIRSISTVVQTLIRTSRDDPEPNPHRGAMHTIPAAAIFGFGSYWLTTLGGKVDLPLLGVISYGDLFAIILLFVMTHLVFASLAKPLKKKVEKSGILGELSSFVVSLAIAIMLFYSTPDGLNFWWLGVSVFIGCVIHILGDCFTTYGAPILFPISFFLKGKFWWNTRFTSIKSGGAAEAAVFVPVFLVITVIALLKIFNLM